MGGGLITRVGRYGYLVKASHVGVLCAITSPVHFSSLPHLGVELNWDGGTYPIGCYGTTELW